MKEETIVVISDMQVPYHNKKHVKNVISFVRSFGPDVLVNIGDDIDAPEPAHWSKGAAMEYSLTLQKACDETAALHREFCEASAGARYHVSRSNHPDRITKYIARYAPALRSLKSLDLEELLGYRELGMKYETKPWVVAPGWVACHGDEGTTSPLAGRTAAGLSKRWGASVVCGHTHRAGLSPSSTGYNGRTATRWGMEVGHLMDVSKAHYLKAGHADWQSAFGVLYRRGDKVHPVIVPIQKDGSFCVEGIWYGTNEKYVTFPLSTRAGMVMADTTPRMAAL